MNIAIVDTETGGLNPFQGHALLSIGAVCGQNQFEAYIEPDLSKVSIDPEAAKVNGWPHAFADFEKYPEREVMGEFLKFIEANQITHLVAHNCAFDYGFLLGAITRSGLYRKNILPRMLCTQAMAHYAKSKGVLNTTSLSLNAVSRTLGFPDTRNKEHSAIEDAILCENVYNALLGINIAPTSAPPQSTPTRRPVIQRLSGR